jgi:Arrestin (or S-antigen), N-terminal domain
MFAEKAVYTAGDTINVTVQLHLERITKIRSLEIRLEGQERVIIESPILGTYLTPQKSHSISTNEILSVSLRVLEDTTLPLGDSTLGAQLQLPSDALPSYLGQHASVTWKLSARADIPWRTDLYDQGYLRVMALHPEEPVAVSMENSEARPKIRLELPSNIYEPGETITGKVTLLEPGNLHEVRLQIVQHEDATARGSMNNSHKAIDREAGSVVRIRLDGFSSGSTTFQLPIPATAPSSYKGTYSWTSWTLNAALDTPHGQDIHLYTPILVGLRKKPEHSPAPTTTAARETVEQAAPLASSVNQGTSSVTLLQQTQPSTAEPFTSTVEDRKTLETRNAIINILSDGSSKDLLTISTELQQKTSEYLDIAQVRKLCEDLVFRGKLTKTGEGEFFARYNLKTLGYT